jgi:DNA replication protein DnaC
MAEAGRIFAENLPVRTCKQCGGEGNDVGPALVCQACRDKNQRIQSAIGRLPTSLRGMKWWEIWENSGSGAPLGNMVDVKYHLLSAYPKRRSVYLHGGSGCGKTSLFAAMYRRAAVADIPVRWTHSQGFYDLLKAGYQAGRGDADLISELVYTARTGILFIDDLGVKNPGAWAVEALETLIQRLYEERGETCVWISSNYSLARLTRRLLVTGPGDDAVARENAVIAVERVVSRIREMTQEIELTAPNWRMKQR